LDLHCTGATYITIIETHAPKIEKCLGQVIGDASITVVVVNIKAADGCNRDDQGLWQAATVVNVGVILTRDADVGGAKTLVDAAAAVQAAIKDGTVAKTLSLLGCPINAVSMNSEPQVIEAEDVPAFAGAAPVMSMWVIALIAVGGVIVVSVIVVASVVIVRRRRAAAAAAAAGAAAGAASAAPQNNAAVPPASVDMA